MLFDRLSIVPTGTTLFLSASSASERILIRRQRRLSAPLRFLAAYVRGKNTVFFTTLGRVCGRNAADPIFLVAGEWVVLSWGDQLV